MELDAIDEAKTPSSRLREQRRPAAIVFADVVGFSTFMAADEHGTFTRWTGLLRELIEPEIARLGGTVANVAGDGILAVFTEIGAAVEWARTVQRSLRVRMEGAITDPGTDRAANWDPHG